MGEHEQRGVGDDVGPSARDLGPQHPMGAAGSVAEGDTGLDKPLREEDVSEDDMLDEDERLGDDGDLPGG